MIIKNIYIHSIYINTVLIEKDSSKVLLQFSEIKYTLYKPVCSTLLFLYFLLSEDIYFHTI